MQPKLSLKQIQSNNAEYNSWIVELKSILVNDYEFPANQAEDYGNHENWTGYFEDGYTPREAIAEDSEYWATT